MARRLLGADSAATVFNIQEPEEDPAIQVHKTLQFHREKNPFHFSSLQAVIVLKKNKSLHKTINMHPIGQF